MHTKRLTGMVCLVALVALGVVGVDRMTKDAKARDAQAPLQVVVPRSSQTGSSTPVAANSTVHFQVDPSVPSLPPAPPTDDKPTPLTSTGELEKQLKDSLENLQKVLPNLAISEVASPEAPAQKIEVEKKSPALPPITDTPAVVKDPAVPPLPPIENRITPPGGVRPMAEVPPPPAFNPVPPAFNASPKSAATDEAPKPLSPSVALPPVPQSPTIPPMLPGEPMAVQNAAVTLTVQDALQMRLAELEMTYLTDTAAELQLRMKQMPASDAQRRKLEMDHRRVMDRIQRLTKVAELTLARRLDDPGKAGVIDSPWTMNMETVDGKTVLQMIVHRKARFKIVCDRLDLQTPHGTMLAVGHVHLTGDGFQGTCDRLSISLHEDRLILEGNAEVGVRTQEMPGVDDRKEGTPPQLQPRKASGESPMVTTVSMLHLKGDHLDLRWSDLTIVPTVFEGPRNDDPIRPTIRATPGPMVKVSYASPGEERWSQWGTLRPTTLKKDGRPMYMLEDPERRLVAYIHTPAGMSLAEYLGKRVSVFGRPLREEGSPLMTFTASHVAWE